MNIYVGNLAPEVTEEELKQEFETFGAPIKAGVVVSVAVENCKDN